MQLDEVRLVRFQQRIQFSDGALHLLFDGIVMIEVLETDGKFHKRTCRMDGERNEGRGLSLEAASSGA